jgi:RNA polymerase sigma-70 factor, ECF subfamily
LAAGASQEARCDEYGVVDVPGGDAAEGGNTVRRDGIGRDDVSRAGVSRAGVTGGRPAVRGIRSRDAVSSGKASLEAMLAEVAKGNEVAFRAVYDQAAPAVLGVARRVLRDPAQSEEVMQEVLLEVWRTAARFDPAAGSATAWIITLAHRRSVDRVRSEQRAVERELRAASASVAYDEVSEAVEAALEQERVRRCLDGLTNLQRESVTLAYYGGYTYAEVARLLGAPVGTVKTRMRDGLIRLRDCLGVD